MQFFFTLCFSVLFFSNDVHADLNDQSECPENQIYVIGRGCVNYQAVNQEVFARECESRGGRPYFNVGASGSQTCVMDQTTTESGGCGNPGQDPCPPAPPPPSQNQPPPPRQQQAQNPGAKPADDKNKQAGDTNKQPGKDTVPEGTADDAMAPAELSATAKALEEEANKQCIQSKRDAQSCCRDPMTCLLGRSNPETSGAISTLLGLVGTGAAVAIGAQQGGNDAGMQACKALNLLGYGSAGINGIAAGSCTTKKLSCESACGEVRTKAEKLSKAYCAESRGTSGTCGKIKQAIVTASVSIQECGYLNAEIQQMGGQAIAGGTGAAISSLCNSLSAASVGFASLDRPPVFNGDCSTNPSNPACVNCADPKFASNPICLKSTPPAQLGDGGSTLAKANYGNGTGTGTANVGSLEGAATQAPVTPNIPIEANRNSGIGGGGGGGGFGSAAAQPNNDPQQGGSGGPGVNADIMQGTVGGNGFSGYGGSTVQTGGGADGFSGYGGGNGGANKQPGFNLAQFLPGGARAPAGRGLAGASVGRQLASQLGSVKENIWMRYSRRMLIVCERVKCPQ